jgi:hypothetical protein
LIGLSVFLTYASFILKPDLNGSICGKVFQACI